MVFRRLGRARWGAVGGDLGSQNFRAVGAKKKWRAVRLSPKKEAKEAISIDLE